MAGTEVCLTCVTPEASVLLNELRQEGWHDPLPRGLHCFLHKNPTGTAQLFVEKDTVGKSLNISVSR